MIKKFLIIFSLCFILLSNNAQASSINNASIMIHAQKSNEEFKLLQIAFYEDGKYIYKEPFTMLEGFDENMPSINKKQLAKKVQTLIKEQNMDYDQVKKNDEKGNVTFDKLQLGLYFITKEESDQFLMDPFLINLPLNMNGQMIYNLNVEPKFEKVPEIQEENGPSPETGDHNEVLFYTLWALTTLSIFIYLNIKVKKQGLFR